jgi:hypothetical protein
MSSEPIEASRARPILVTNGRSVSLAMPESSALLNSESEAKASLSKRWKSLNKAATGYTR